MTVRRAPRLLRSVRASAVGEDGGMASVAILVNGLPGSGKTTLSATLAGVLGCPLLAKDPISEALVDLAGPMIAPEALGGIAMDTVWAMAGEVEAGVVVDAFWHRERDLEFARAGVERAGSPRTVEVWCDVDPDTALQRVVDALGAMPVRAIVTLGPALAADAVHSSAPHVVYAGSLQGRSPKPAEQGAKGAVLVTVQDDRIADLRHVPLDRFRFAAVEVDVSGLADTASVLDALRRAGLELSDRLERHVNRRTGRRAGEYFESILIATHL